MKNIQKLITQVPIIKTTSDTNSVFTLMEKYNITGSIKIKTVFRMLKDALEKKALYKNKIILEASSGNTAIALSYLSNILHLKTQIILPSATSQLKKQLTLSYGAEIIEIEGKTDEAVQYRNKLYQQNPDNYYLPDQFTNYNNMFAHYYLTGPWIRKNISYLQVFAAGLGTSGTLLGTAKFLKEKNPDIKIIAINPTDRIEGLRNFKDTKISIPFYDEYKYLIDEVIDVNYDGDAKEGVKEIFKSGHFVGLSSRATHSGLLKYLKGKKGVTAVSIAPDGGDFYPELL